MRKNKLYDKDGKYVKTAKVHPVKADLQSWASQNFLARTVAFNRQGLYLKKQLAGAKS